jgi:tRNA nucleotidyltransferase/poly(A) polymerase
LVNGRDTKSEGPKVELENVTLYDDLQRRDLTINSLVYDIETNQIWDYTGGLVDLERSIIRMVGEPAQRFQEDRLRLLRALRFAARFHATIDPITATAIHTDHRLRGLPDYFIGDTIISDNVSQERIVQEVLKTFEHAQKDPSLLQLYFQFIQNFDLWFEMFPGLRFELPLTGLEPTISDPAVILATLVRGEKSRVKKLKAWLMAEKFDHVLSGQIQFLLTFETHWGNTEMSFDLLLQQQRYGVTAVQVQLYCQLNNLWNVWSEKYYRYSLQGITTSGDALVAAGFKGQAVGEEKRRLEIEKFRSL